MSQQNNKFTPQYLSLMRTVALRVWSKGTQKDCAVFLGISPANLSRILTCAVACQSTLFLRLLNYVDMSIFASIRTDSCEVYPGVSSDDYVPVCPFSENI